MLGTYVCLLVVPLMSITEQEAVYAQYTGPNGRPTTQFSDIVALESADAVGVTKGIEKGLEAVDIYDELLKEKLLGCNFDGPSMMMDKRGGGPSNSR